MVTFCYSFHFISLIKNNNTPNLLCHSEGCLQHLWSDEMCPSRQLDSVAQLFLSFEGEISLYYLYLQPLSVGFFSAITGTPVVLGANLRLGLVQKKYPALMTLRISFMVKDVREAKQMMDLSTMCCTTTTKHPQALQPLGKARLHSLLLLSASKLYRMPLYLW